MRKTGSDQKVTQFSCVLAQVHRSSTEVLQLKAVFQVTPEFLLWYSFSFNRLHISDVEAVSESWYRSEAWHALDPDIFDEATMSEIVQLQPMQALSSNTLLFVKSFSQSVQRDDNDVLQSPSEGIMSFIKLLVHLTLDTGNSGQVDTVSWEQKQQASSDQQQSSAPASVWGPFRRTLVLRPASVLFKLLAFVTAAESRARISLAMWHVLSRFTQDIQSSCSSSHESWDCHEEQWISLQLTELAVHALGQQEKSHNLQVETCCLLLQALLTCSPKSVCRAVASKIIASGAASLSRYVLM